MRTAETEQLSRGACLDLRIEVVDKYFLAVPQVEYFHYLTALAICSQCPVRTLCLTDAIRLPRSGYGVRGGEAADAILTLRQQLEAGEGTAAELAVRAIARQQPSLASRILRNCRPATLRLMNRLPFDK